VALAASRIGYPLMVKAVAGGGGKGMRRVDDPKALAEAVAACAREAGAAFGDARLILERCIDRPRHIEVQVFADRHGNVVHLHERDCSLQRRHQKVIEEAPAPNLPPRLRAAMLEAAVTAARAVGYEGAGTVEFICACDRAGAPDGFWFLEMNTRLQVEHPVTEAITGLDLVEWQFRVAAGEPLPLAQGAIRTSGHAVEARLYAENPATGFLPQTGLLHRLRWPDGVRVDAGVEEGGEVTAFYDPLLAKVIAHGDTREAAFARLTRALSETRLMGVTTNRAFLMALACDREVLAGRIETGLIDCNLERLCAPDKALTAAAVRALAGPPPASPLPFSALTGFALTGLDRRDQLDLIINGRREGIDIVWQSGGSSEIESTNGRVALGGWSEQSSGLGCVASGQWLQADVVRDAGRVWIAGGHGDVDIAFAPLDVRAAAGAKGEAVVRAPMPGRIGRLLAEEGAAVTAGAPLLTLEAMKMEHMVRAGTDGTARLLVGPGDQVDEGQALAEIVAEPEPGP
jgi:acetyl/propionyl-CoA carboxylase alpha subunit